MRLPIVQYPRIVAENLSYFATVFETVEQRKHFCEYVTGLIAGDKATIAAINALFLNKNDQSALNKFVSQAQWSEDELNYRRVQFELERLYRRPVSASAGRLILDDTLAHHTKCSMEGLAYLRDHTVGHNVWAHNVVTSYYVNRSDQFPVDFGSITSSTGLPRCLPFTSFAACSISRTYRRYCERWGGGGASTSRNLVLDASAWSRASRFP